MTEKNRNLVVRILSAIFLLPAVAYLLIHGLDTTAALMCFAAGAVAYEFYGICLTRGSDHVRYLGILAAAAIPAVFLYVHTQPTFAQLTLALMGVLVATFSYYLIAGPLETAPTKAALTFFGVLYAGLGVGSLAALRAVPEGLAWVFLAIVLTFGNDTGGYFAGRLLGKHKLYVAVSPNKTWEGFIGGMVFTTSLAFGMRATFMPFLTPIDALALGIPCSLLGPAGDLCESMLKRAYGVKDSGSLIPGHGGLLDRVDALLFNAPYLLFYASARFGG